MDERPADEVFSLRLQVGRVLRGRLLSLAVVLRTLPLMLLAGDTDAVAPAWVVVADTTTGETRWRVSAGRGFGNGEHLLEAMRSDLSCMTAAEFEGERRK